MNFFKKNELIKKFNFAKKSFSGRNNQGHITIKHRVKGHKKNYKILDFFRLIKNMPCKVRRLEYDCSRNTYIALVCYKNSILSYILSYENIKINDFIISSPTYMNFSFGNSTILQKAFVGSFIYNLEYFPYFGGKISRSGGSFCQVLKRFNDSYILVKLKSKEYRIFFKNCFFSYGVVLNKYKKFEKMYKAGQNIYRGFRPSVRGEAMNPVDHPHGGNTSGGRHPVSFTGKLTKGVKTRLKYKNNYSLIIKRRYNLN